MRLACTSSEFSFAGCADKSGRMLCSMLLPPRPRRPMMAEHCDVECNRQLSSTWLRPGDIATRWSRQGRAASESGGLAGAYDMPCDTGRVPACLHPAQRLLPRCYLWSEQYKLSVARTSTRAYGCRVQYKGTHVWRGTSVLHVKPHAGSDVQGWVCAAMPVYDRAGEPVPTSGPLCMSCHADRTSTHFERIRLLTFRTSSDGFGLRPSARGY